MLRCWFGCCTDNTTQRDKNCHSDAPSSVSGTILLLSLSVKPSCWEGAPGGRAAHPPNATLAHVSSLFDFTVPRYAVPDTQAPSPVPSSLPRSVPTWRSLRPRPAHIFPPQIPHPDSISIPPPPAALSKAQQPCSGKKIDKCLRKEERGCRIPLFSTY